MKKICWFIVCMSLLILLLSGCMEPKETYYITVTVSAVDSESGTSITNANIVTAEGKTGSNSGGVFSFQLEGVREYEFIATAPNYSDQHQRVSVGKENLSVTIKMQQGKGTIKGKVVDDTEEVLIPGLEKDKIMESGLSQVQLKIEELNRNLESNDDGTFLFENIPYTDSVYTLIVSKSGYGERTIGNIKVNASNPEANLGTIILSSEPGTLTGKVINEKDNPLDNIVVTVVETSQTITTSYDGAYSLSILPGTYTVEFSHLNYNKLSVPGVIINKNANTQLNVKLVTKPGSVTGMVVDNYAAPLSDVQVNIVGTSLNSKTLSNGYFNITDIPPGDYILEFKHPQFRTQNTNCLIESNKETVISNVTLTEKTGILTGRVLEDGNNNPIANANIRAVENGDTCATNSEGYYIFSNLRIGTYTIEISANSCSKVSISNVVIKENSITTLSDTVLIRNPAIIIGVCRDTITHANLNQTLVTLIENNVSCTTNETGSFRFEGVKPGSYTLKLEKDKYVINNISGIFCGPNQTVNLGVIDIDPQPAQITGITTPNAQVELSNGVKTVASSGGNFVLTDIDEGTYTLTISLATYYSYSQSITLGPGDVIDLGSKVLTPKVGSFAGTVKDNVNNSSLSGVTVTIIQTNASAQTDATGHFKIDNVRPGTYSLKYVINHYNSKIDVNVTCIEEKENDLGIIYIDPIPASIYGITTPNALVKLRNTTLSTVASSTGAFNLGEITPGNYTVDITLATYATYTQVITLTPEQSLDLGSHLLAPKVGSFTGTVKNSVNNGLLNGVTVTIMQTGASAQTDATGHFTINNVRPGTYSLQFVKNHYNSQTISSLTCYEEQENDVGIISLDPKKASIYGITTPNAVIQLRGTSLSTVASPTGSFTIGGITPGNYTVDIALATYATLTLTISLTPEQSKDLGTVLLTPKVGSFTGTVKNSVNINPLGGVTVTLVQTSVSVTTDVSGNFTINNVRPGIYSIQFTLSNYNTKIITNLTCYEDQNNNQGIIYIDPMPGTIVGMTNPSATVQLRGTSLSATASGTGAFTLAGVVMGNYNLDISLPNYTPKTVPVTVNPNKTTNIGSVILAGLPGRITGETNASNVTIVQTNQSVAPSGSVFTFENVNPGTYTVRYTLNHYYSQDITVTLGPNETKDLGVITLSPKPAAINGYTLAGCTVTLIEAQNSQPSGAFSFTNLLPGLYHLKVEQEDHEFYLLDVTINPEETRNVGGLAAGPIFDYLNCPEKRAAVASGSFLADFDQTISWSGEATCTAFDYASCQIDGYLAYYLRNGSIPSTVGFSGSKSVQKGNIGIELHGFINVSIAYQMDNQGPRVSFDHTWGYGGNVYVTTVSAVDQYSRVATVEYAIVPTRDLPSSWRTGTNNGTITIGGSGVWYLYVKATDIRGNVGIHEEGPYFCN